MAMQMLPPVRHKCSGKEIRVQSSVMNYVANSRAADVLDWRNACDALFVASQTRLSQTRHLSRTGSQWLPLKGKRRSLAIGEHGDYCPVPSAGPARRCAGGCSAASTARPAKSRLIIA